MVMLEIVPVKQLILALVLKYVNLDINLKPDLLRVNVPQVDHTQLRPQFAKL